MNNKELILINNVLQSCSDAGFHFLSVDTIAKDSGISKATIYKYFNSKEQLFARSLDAYKDKTLFRLEELYADNSLSLSEKIDQRFEMLKNNITPNFNGCIVQLAYTEYCNQDDEIANVCHSFKKMTQERLSSLLESNGIPNPIEKSIMAEMVYNGLLASLQINKNDDLIDRANNLYKKIIFENLDYQ